MSPAPPMAPFVFVMRRTLNPLRVIDHQPDWVQALSISPDGTRLAAGRYNGSLTLYDTKTQKSSPGQLRAAATPELTEITEIFRMNVKILITGLVLTLGGSLACSCARTARLSRRPFPKFGRQACSEAAQPPSRLTAAAFQAPRMLFLIRRA